MKLKLVLAALLSSSALAQDAFYKEHCENTISAVNLKTGEKYEGDATKISSGSDNLEWKDDKKNFKITLQDWTMAEGIFPQISQTFRTLEAGPQTNQTIANIEIRNYRLLDYKVKTNDFKSRILVTTISPTEQTAHDLGKEDPHLPDQSMITVPGTLGATTTTQTQLQPYIKGDFRIDTSVTICTDTPVQESDIKLTGFYKGATAPIATFNKQHTATMAAKKEFTDCQAKPDPKDCSALDKKYQASAKNRESIWTSLIRASKLPVPKKPRPPGGGGGGGTVIITNGDCTWNSDCGNGMACINNYCTKGQCSRRSDCPFYESCVNGMCAGVQGTGCVSSTQCIGSEQCVRGVCTDDMSKGGCRDDSECQSGKTCSTRNLCE